MKPPESSKTVKQKRVIFGLLRECLFLETQFEFSYLSHEITSAELVHIDEKNRRDENENKILNFRIQLKEDELPHEEINRLAGKTIKLKFGIESHSATGAVKVVKAIRDGNALILLTEVPSELNFENARKSRRKRGDFKFGAATVLVRSGNSHTEGIFELTDYSQGGYGGILTVPKSFEFLSNTTVTGQLTIKSENVPLYCRVRRATLFQSRRDDWISYNVGLETNITGFNGLIESETSSRNERRTSSRLTVQEQVLLTPVLNENAPFRFLIDEASITGFSGRLFNTAHQFGFPVGAIFRLESPSITVALKGFENDRFRFSIQSGDLNARLEWFKRVSPYLLEGVSDSVFEARDLLEVFCASGALSAEYLTAQRTHKSDIMKPLESSINEHFWLHRWIHHNPEKNVTGHWSAIRIGDCSWLLGDLAGSPELARKIPPNFTEAFFGSFSDFCLSQSPCPTHMITWISGHPYWEPFYKSIQRTPHLLEEARVGYTRYISETLRTAPPAAIQKEEIIAQDYLKIAQCHELLLNNECLKHALNLDFDTYRFGSPMLKDQFRTSELGYWRRYFMFEVDQLKLLVVFTAYPQSGSVNRVPESIWVLPLKAVNSLWSKNWTQLSNEIFATGLSLGIKPSSIRRITLKNESSLFPMELALLDSLVLHPSATRMYRSR